MIPYPQDADGEVLGDLAAQGIDMSKLLSIEFPVAVPNEAAANRTAAAVIKAGFESQIAYDEGELSNVIKRRICLHGNVTIA